MNKIINKHVIWNTVGSAMFAAVTFIMLMLVSQITDVFTVGIFGISITNSQLLYIIGIFGVTSYQMTDFEKRFSFSEYFWLKIFSCLLMMLACICIVLLYNDIYKIYFTLLLTTFMLLNAVAELYQSLLFQNNRIDLSGQSLFFRTFFSLLAYTIIIIYTKSIILALFFLLGINIICTWYWSIRKTKIYIESTHSFNIHRIWLLIKESFPLFISMFLMTLIINAPKIGIEIFSDDITQGYFNIIFIPAQMINLCSQFVFKPMLAKYASLLKMNNKKPFYKLYYKQILFISLVATSVSIILYTFGYAILGWLFNTNLKLFRFETTLLIVSGGIFAICQLSYYILVILRKQKIILILYALAVITACAIIPYFINTYNLLGACLSYVVPHITLLSGYILFIHKITHPKLLKEKL